MQIHPAVDSSDLSKRWKQETNCLLYSHPRSDRMLRLLEEPELSRRVGRLGDYPNCFGTAFWVIGLIDYDLPEIIPEEDVQSFIENNGFKQIKNNKNLTNIL